MNTKSVVADNKNKIVMNVCFWAFLVIDVIWISAVLSVGYVLISRLSQ